MLQLVQVDALVPREHKGQGLLGASMGRGLLLDVDPVRHKQHPHKELVDSVRFRLPWPQCHAAATPKQPWAGAGL
jgi:hypothetical protein